MLGESSNLSWATMKPKLDNVQTLEYAMMLGVCLNPMAGGDASSSSPLFSKRCCAVHNHENFPYSNWVVFTHLDDADFLPDHDIVKFPQNLLFLRRSFHEHYIQSLPIG